MPFGNGRSCRVSIPFTVGPSKFKMWRQKHYLRWLLVFSSCFIFFAPSSTKALDLVISNDSGSFEIFWWSELIDKNGNRPANLQRSGTLAAGQSMKAGYGVNPFGDHNQVVKTGGEIVVYAYQTQVLQPGLATQFLHSFNYIAHLTWKLANDANQVCVIHLHKDEGQQEWLQSELLSAGGGGGGGGDMSGVEDRLDDLIVQGDPDPPEVSTVEETHNDLAQMSNESLAEDHASGIRGLFDRAFGIEAAVSAVPASVFLIGPFTVGSETMEINWDPREMPLIMAGGMMIKALLTMFMFYLLIMYLWNWFEGKVESLAQTNASGTSGEAVLGTNANLATSAVNASVMMSCILFFILCLLSLIIDNVYGSCVSDFLDTDSVITGESSVFSSDSGQQLLVLTDIFLPITCILSVFFTYIITRITGHSCYIGCTTVVKFANA